MHSRVILLGICFLRISSRWRPKLLSSMLRLSHVAVSVLVELLLTLKVLGVRKSCVLVVSLWLLTSLRHIGLHTILCKACSIRALPSLGHVRTSSWCAFLRRRLRCWLQWLRRSECTRVRRDRLAAVHLRMRSSTGGSLCKSRKCWRRASGR